MPARVTPNPQTPNTPPNLTPQEFAKMFRLPPEQAVKFLQDKGIQVTFDWRDMWQDEHARAFTISRLTSHDLLQSIQDRLVKSINGDLSRRDWMRQAKALLQAEGWWGKIPVEDQVTGETVHTRFDSNRLRLIYDVNTRTAAAVGQWERFEKTKSHMRYLRYVTKRDEKVREHHRNWHNLTLPVDHPFWDTHAPPNGLRCRCSLTAMDQKDYDKGVAPGGAPLNKSAPQIKMREWLNKRTGKVEMVPEGIDPGWAYNPGKAGMRKAGMAKLVEDKVTKMDAPIGASFASQVRPALKEIQKERWSQWLAQVRSGIDRNALGMLGVVTMADLSLLASERVVPLTAEVMVRPGIVSGPKADRHALEKDALTSEQWENLPELFEQAKALLFDKKSGKPLWLLPGDGRVPQLAVEVDFVTKKPKQTVNAVVSAKTYAVEDIKARIKGGEVVLLRGSVE